MGGLEGPRNVFRIGVHALLIKQAVMSTRATAAMAVIFAAGLTATPIGTVRAAEEGSHVEGSGFSLFETESIHGFDEKKVAKDPVCDPSIHPKITKVEPDVVKPGDRVVIQGENFGTKECLQSVSFSAPGGEKVRFKYVNESRIEATVPNIKSGMTFIHVVSGGGSAQSKGILVQAK